MNEKTEEVVVEEKDTAPMYKDGVEMEVSKNPAGRAILAKEGWKDTKK